MKASQGLGRRLRRILRYYYLRLVRIDDSPEKIAGGVALGVFLGVFPTFGLGLILAVALAHRMHVNRAAALLGSLVMNPVTTPVFWGLSAWAGAAVFGVKRAEILGLVQEFESRWASAFGWLGLAYSVGNTLVAAACAAVAYFLALRVARVVHHRRRERRHRRALRRQAARAAAGRPGGAMRPTPAAEGPDVRPGA